MNCFSWHLKSENKLDDNNEFEAYIRKRHLQLQQLGHLRVRCHWEALQVLLNYNFANRFPTMFIENSCEVVGIEKTERGHQTEYIDTLKNCGYHDVVNEFFVFVLRVNNA